MLLESITAVSQLFVNILTYDHLYAYDGPTTFMYLCKKKLKINFFNKKLAIRRHKNSLIQLVNFLIGCRSISKVVNKLVFIPSTIVLQITQNLI